MHLNQRKSRYLTKIRLDDYLVNSLLGIAFGSHVLQLSELEPFNYLISYFKYCLVFCSIKREILAKFSREDYRVHSLLGIALGCYSSIAMLLIAK